MKAARKAEQAAMRDMRERRAKTARFMQTMQRAAARYSIRVLTRHGVGVLIMTPRSTRKILTV